MKSAGPRRQKVFSLAYTGQQQLASGGTDNAIRLWNVSLQTETHRMTGHTGTVAVLAFDPVHRVLVSGSFDTTVAIWNLPVASDSVAHR